MLIKTCFGSLTQQVQDDEKWKTWAELDTYSQAKVLALKVYIQYCLMGLPTTIRIGHRNTAIISRLHFVVANVGQVKPETKERLLSNTAVEPSLLLAKSILPNAFDSGALAGHLRLVAATGLTKLATYREYDKLIANACFEEIAYQIQVGTARRLEKYQQAHDSACDH